MTPGRELDALVAETVMDCKVAKILDYGVEGNYRYRCDCPGPNSTGERPHANEHSFDCDIKDYSTDIAAAWEVVEKFVAKLAFSGENGFVLDYSCGSWTATFRHSISEFGKSVESLADTAPHAICLAALKAVGVEA